MEGNYIKGIDQATGNECSGTILDKVRSMATLQARSNNPLDIGKQGQAIPIPLDMYLVYNEAKEELYLVMPNTITEVYLKTAKENAQPG